MISGLGLVCPLGHSAWQTFRALLNGATIADRAANLPDELDPVELVRAAGCVSIAQHTSEDPTVELAERAARESLADAAVDPSGLEAVIGASKGAVCAATSALTLGLPGDMRRRLFPGVLNRQPAADAELAVALGPQGYLSHHLKRRLRLGQVRNVVAACASSLSALHHAHTRMLRSGAGDPCLVVSSEAALLPAFIHSYRRLGVLPPMRRDLYCGRPLDGRRCGFMLAEMGAAVVLEAVNDLREGQIELVDTAVAAEGFDLVRSPPTLHALSHVAEQLFRNRRIDLIHPHATGTIEHDPAEVAAYTGPLRSSCCATPPDLYAVKGALGHGLGTGGLVSLVIAVLCARTARRPPMPWLDKPIEGGNAGVAIRKGEGQKVPRQGLGYGGTPTGSGQAPARRGGGECHAVFAAGFGGHVAGAVIRRV